jgi:hypothetical protein
MTRTSRLLGCFAVLLFVGAAGLPAMAATAKPGSVDPAATTTEEPVTSGVVEPEKQAKKSKVRRHRYARYRHYRHYGFFFPPPRYWFRPGWHYRYHRHRRYSGFPFFFRW